MNYNIEVTADFEKDLKKLSKKYHSLKSDLTVLVEQLSINPTLGIHLGGNLYKIRMAISSKKKAFQIKN